MSERLYCPICNELIEDTQGIVEHNGEFYHQDCFDENFTQCDYCHEYHSNDEIRWLDNYNQYVCDTCIDEDFFRCNCCA